MTKLSFINNNPDDRRLTIRKLSKESTIAPLAEVLNSYTLSITMIHNQTLM